MIPFLWMPDGTDFWSQYSYDKLICRKCQAITALLILLCPCDLPEILSGVSGEDFQLHLPFLKQILSI